MPPLVNLVDGGLRFPKLQELVLPQLINSSADENAVAEYFNDYSKLRGRKLKRLILRDSPDADIMLRLRELVEEVKVRHVQAFVDAVNFRALNILQVGTHDPPEELDFEC